MNFSKEDILDIMYEGGVWDQETDNQTFETVQDKVDYTDLEKGYQDHECVIREIATDKFYAATIKSNIDEVTVRGEWKEVQAKTVTQTITTTTYE